MTNSTKRKAFGIPKSHIADRVPQSMLVMTAQTTQVVNYKLEVILS
jgi:hypothetical protein